MSLSPEALLTYSPTGRARNGELTEGVAAGIRSETTSDETPSNQAVRSIFVYFAPHGTRQTVQFGYRAAGCMNLPARPMHQSITTPTIGRAAAKSIVLRNARAKPLDKNA